MLGHFGDEIAEAIARDEYETNEHHVYKSPKFIVARYLYLRISAPHRRQYNIAIYVNNVVGKLEQSFLTDSELALASRRKFCHLVVDRLGGLNAVALLDDTHFTSQTCYSRNLSHVHDAITLAIALGLPESLELYSDEWKENAYHAVLLPSPIALASTSNSAPLMLDKLLLHPVTAEFASSHNMRWYHISSAWEYAVKHGKMTAARKIAQKYSWIDCLMSGEAYLGPTLRSLIEGDHVEELESCSACFKKLKRTVMSIQISI